MIVELVESEEWAIVPGRLASAFGSGQRYSVAGGDGD